MEAARDNRYRFSSARRLKATADFSAMLATPRARSLTMARQLLSVTAAWKASQAADAETARVRFGVTVGKRNARRAVDRALIKRIVREACRHQAGAFEACAARAAVGIDVVVRLKSQLIDGKGQALAMTQWRRQLRVEADALLGRALGELAARTPAQVN